MLHLWNNADAKLIASSLRIKFYHVTAYLSSQILFLIFQLCALTASLESRAYLLKNIALCQASEGNEESIFSVFCHINW